MKVVKGIKNLKQKFKKPVLTMGMFDGVHLAHQRIIKEVIHQAKILKGTSMVLTFTPHPLKVFSRYPTMPLISSLERRIDLIRRMNIDICLLLDFNKRFSRLSAQDFVKHILIDGIGVNYVIVGKGFHFGRNRKGSFSLLKKLSKIYGFKTRQIKTVRISAQTLSSTKIRALIQKGKIAEANKFLGRKFSFTGRVKKGNRRGQILGYPTANIELQQQLMPSSGVYAVLVKLGNKIYRGILNIGVRPTFSLKKKSSNIIEVHIFNFHNKIYGKRLEVFFIQRIRSEKKFLSWQKLLQQIKKDELKAKKILKAKNLP